MNQISIDKIKTTNRANKERTKQKASNLKEEDSELDPLVCTETKEIFRFIKMGSRGTRYICSHCPKNSKLYTDDKGILIRGKFSNRKVEFPRHVMESPPECLYARSDSAEKIWLDPEGYTWWESEDEMKTAKERRAQQESLVDYEVAQ